MKITEVKQRPTKLRPARFSPKFPADVRAIVEGTRDPQNIDDYKEKIKTLLDLEKFTQDDPSLMDAIKDAYKVLAQWKMKHDRQFEGKSSHKKGTKKYKDQMAAIHANKVESTEVDEYLGHKGPNPATADMKRKGPNVARTPADRRRSRERARGWAVDSDEDRARTHGARVPASGQWGKYSGDEQQQDDIGPFGTIQGREDHEDSRGKKKKRGAKGREDASLDPVGPTISQMSDEDLADYISSTVDQVKKNREEAEEIANSLSQDHANESEVREMELGRMEFTFDKDEWSEEELESLASMDGAEWDVDAGTITASGHRPATLKVLNRLAHVMPGVEVSKTSKIPSDQGRNIDNRAGQPIKPMDAAPAKYIAKKMSKVDTMKGWADRVSDMGGMVSRDDLEKLLPDYVSGGDITALFDSVQVDEKDSPDSEDWDNDVTKALRKIVDEHQAQKVKFDDGKKTTVDAFTASAVIQGLDALRPDLQVKAADFINQSSGHLVKFSEMVFGSQKEGYGESVDPVGLAVNVMREAFADYEKDSSERWNKYSDYRSLRQRMAHIAKRVEVREGKMKELDMDLKDKEMSDADFKKKYGKGKAEMQKSFDEKIFGDLRSS